MEKNKNKNKKGKYFRKSFETLSEEKQVDIVMRLLHRNGGSMSFNDINNIISREYFVRGAKFKNFHMLAQFRKEKSNLVLSQSSVASTTEEKCQDQMPEVDGNHQTMNKKGKDRESFVTLGEEKQVDIVMRLLHQNGGSMSFNDIHNIISREYFVEGAKFKNFHMLAQFRKERNNLVLTQSSVASTAEEKCQGQVPEVDGNHQTMMSDSDEQNDFEVNIKVDVNIDLIHKILQSFTQNILPNDLKDIILDVGQRPYMTFCNTPGYEVLTESEHTITEKDLENVMASMGGSFDCNNRACFDGELHRISALRNHDGVIYGLTIRVGRVVKGIAGIIDDILFEKANPLSLLILGKPGCGKTTIIRDIARKVSEFGQNTIIVDTSNEIAGAGNVVHPSVGRARRIMVRNNQQERAMIEALQNHTPDAMILDEIGRFQEVDAAATVRERGVRIFASAHGETLKSLVNNKRLNNLIGGVQQVILGDEVASWRYSGRKSKRERVGQPVFDVVVELQPNDFFTWTIVKNVPDAVDRILQDQKYEAEVRSIDSTGQCRCEQVWK